MTRRRDERGHRAGRVHLARPSCCSCRCSTIVLAVFEIQRAAYAVSAAARSAGRAFALAPDQAEGGSPGARRPRAVALARPGRSTSRGSTCGSPARRYPRDCLTPGSVVTVGMALPGRPAADARRPGRRHPEHPRSTPSHTVPLRHLPGGPAVTRPGRTHGQAYAADHRLRRRAGDGGRRGRRRVGGVPAQRQGLDSARRRRGARRRRRDPGRGRSTRAVSASGPRSTRSVARRYVADVPLGHRRGPSLPGAERTTSRPAPTGWSCTSPRPSTCRSPPGVGQPATRDRDRRVLRDGQRLHRRSAAHSAASTRHA